MTSYEQPVRYGWRSDGENITAVPGMSKAETFFRFDGVQILAQSVFLATCNRIAECIMLEIREARRREYGREQL